MTTSPADYLQKILRDQDLDEDSTELKKLRTTKEEVTSHLKSEFSECTPTIRYGGSYMKKTLIRENYDLDVACYFPRDDDDAGASLKEIYENVAQALAKEYVVERKTSALRLRSTAANQVSLSVDVVPGRFIHDDDGDVFLHQNGAEKDRLKTNLDTHLKHIRDSGVRPAIRLLKLWKTRYNVPLKTFGLELLAIDILEDEKTTPLDEQFVMVLEAFRDETDALTITDPANPSNDLSGLLSPGVRTVMKAAATKVLSNIEAIGWESVFGPVRQEEGKSAMPYGDIKTAAAAAHSGTRPWARSEPREP